MTYRYRTHLGKVFVTLAGEKAPERCFAHVGKAGTDDNAAAQSLASIVARAARAGVSPRLIWKDLVGVTAERSNRHAFEALSIPDAIAQAIADTYFPDVHHSGTCT